MRCTVLWSLWLWLWTPSFDPTEIECAICYCTREVKLMWHVSFVIIISSIIQCSMFCRWKMSHISVIKIERKNIWMCKTTFEIDRQYTMEPDRDRALHRNCSKTGTAVLNSLLNRPNFDLSDWSGKQEEHLRLMQNQTILRGRKQTQQVWRVSIARSALIVACLVKSNMTNVIVWPKVIKLVN